MANEMCIRDSFTVNAAEGALVHRGRVHLTHHSPDVGILGREVQDCGLIIIVTGVVEKAFAHLQFDWGAKAVKVRHYTPKMCIRDRDEVLGTVGHLRIDFGSGGKSFWSTWWPHNSDQFNTPEFKRELQQIVDRCV